MENSRPSIIGDFEILLDDFFLNLNPETGLEPVERKKVLSVINSFEDGEWRYQEFQNFIWDNIAETALSYDDRNALINQSHSTLIEAAKNLRLVDNPNTETEGSELAEILLYGFMKHHFKALPAVPKIFYKQNPRDNAKGADSVHVILESDDSFTLWFGESKFYNSIEDARLNRIIDSVEESLTTEKLKKENRIITNVQDLRSILKGKEEIYEKIKKLLSKSTSVDQIKAKLNIPILILHQCEITNTCDQMSEDYKKQIMNYHLERAGSYFKKQINKITSKVFNYEEITFHLILFPVPQKRPIVEKFLKNVEFYKNQ